ncbi:hypothetical protein GCM10023183_08700 [Nibribacter koreensis]|uniref:Uncharacterized protein n=1 Tax=Nibribacter koreensis TaxID=1084519 RepID=A0ABP8FB37_9BACT
MTPPDRYHWQVDPDKSRFWQATPTGWELVSFGPRRPIARLRPKQRTVNN